MMSYTYRWGVLDKSAIGKGQWAKIGGCRLFIVDSRLWGKGRKNRVSLKITFDSRTFNFGKLSYVFRMFRVMPALKWAVYAGFCRSKSSFHFLLRAKRKRNKRKGRQQQSPFSAQNAHPSPIGRLPAGLKCAALFLEVSPPYATWIFNDVLRRRGE